MTRIVGSPKPPSNFTVTKGSGYMVARRAFVRYAIFDPNALALQEWARTTALPDETYFSTLNHSPQMNVPGAYTGLYSVGLIVSQSDVIV